MYEKKRDQRELIKVAQRNFRKFLSMRDWGWFVIIQKTRGMIGMPNPEEELRLLEEKANATYGEYKAALDVTADLESQMGSLKDDIGAMSKQLSEEQGNVSVYTDRQAKALSIKAEAECELAKQQINNYTAGILPAAQQMPKYLYTLYTSYLFLNLLCILVYSGVYSHTHAYFYPIKYSLLCQEQSPAPWLR